jgi:hypothetical protein
MPLGDLPGIPPEFKNSPLPAPARELIEEAVLACMMTDVPENRQS